MKMLRILPFAAALTLTFASLSSAQDNASPPASALEKPASEPHTSGSGTAPEGMGSTGWVGGNRGQTKPETTGSGSAPDPAADQPLMATGSDLKGPPKRFPAAKTPE